MLGRSMTKLSAISKMQPQQLIYLEFVIHGGSGSVPWQKKYSNDI